MTIPYPKFDLNIAKDGYCWWYLDAISDDQHHAITVIAMLGNVFSPYYAWSRNKRATDPLNHCAMNVVLYGSKYKHWAMTERGIDALSRRPDYLQIGPSSLIWEKDHFKISIKEITVPWPSSLKGEIKIFPDTLNNHREKLDEAGRHLWHPISPISRVEVNFLEPDLSWQGEAYFDSNQGERPLEKDFIYWNWSRAPLTNRTAILYDISRRDRQQTMINLLIDRKGHIEKFNAPEQTKLATTGWRIKRETYSDDKSASVMKTLEDTPFYSR
ncbi:MAG: carotenoid 1,2-hydratase, partial [Pseudomonadota bacterium]